MIGIEKETIDSYHITNLPLETAKLRDSNDEVSFFIILSNVRQFWLNSQTGCTCSKDQFWSLYTIYLV